MGTERARADDRLVVQLRGRNSLRRDSALDLTVGDLAHVYIEQYAKPHKRSWKEDHWKLEKYVLPAWRSRPVTEITRLDVHALVDAIAADGKPIQANRTLALVSKMWAVGVDRGYAETSPCYRMAKPAPERARAQVLTDDDIRGLWTALDAEPGHAADALKLRLITGQRGGEVHRMRWEDVDLSARMWTVPADVSKNGRPHRVPLTAPAIEVLERRAAARQAAAPRVFRLSHQAKSLRAMATIHNGQYRWHDLRRTVATRLAELKIPGGTISRVLGHAQRGVTATVYNTYEYDDEKRAALDAWATQLATIVSGNDTSVVVPIQTGR